jgi:hypothetical protein
LATLHSVLEHAISEDWVATNAARGVKVFLHIAEETAIYTEKCAAPLSYA